MIFIITYFSYLKAISFVKVIKIIGIKCTFTISYLVVDVKCFYKGTLILVFSISISQ